MKTKHIIIAAILALLSAKAATAHAMSIHFFPPSAYNADTTAMDLQLGIAGYNIDNFDAANLLSGVSIAYTGNGFNTTLTSLAQVQAYMGGIWAGSTIVTNDPANNPPQISTWPSRTTFTYSPGASSFGIGLSGFQSLNDPEYPVTNHRLYINGVAVPGTLESLAGANWTSSRTNPNAYLRIDAGPGETITSVAFENIQDQPGNSDVLLFSHLAIQDPTTATPNIAYINFDTFPNGAPVPDNTIITTQYSSLGVTFSSTAPAGGPTAGTFAGEESSAPNYLVGWDPTTQSGLYPVTINFTGVLPNAVDLTLISVGAGIATATAYASDGVTVLDKTLPITHGPSAGVGFGNHDPVSLQGTGIASVTIQIQQPPPPAIDGFGIDDVVIYRPPAASGPSLIVQQPVGTSLNIGSTQSLSADQGGTDNLTFTIKNIGADNLTALAITVDGANAADFSVKYDPTVSIPPFGSTTFTVRYSPSTTGAETAAIHISSNDTTQNPFDINLTGQLCYTKSQYDANRIAGQNDVTGSPNTYNLYSQTQYADNRTAGQNDVINSPNTYGLYTLSQVQTLNVNVPLLTKDATTGQFKLTIGIQKTADLSQPFIAFPFTAPNTSINAQGQVEFLFTVPDNAAFFRVQAQ